MKDGRTHLAHKAEHAIDLETGAIVGFTVHGAARQRQRVSRPGQSRHQRPINYQICVDVLGASVLKYAQLMP
jgi:hypothetical protein